MDAYTHIDWVFQAMCHVAFIIKGSKMKQIVIIQGDQIVGSIKTPSFFWPKIIPTVNELRPIFRPKRKNVGFCCIITSRFSDISFQTPLFFFRKLRWKRPSGHWLSFPFFSHSLFEVVSTWTALRGVSASGGRFWRSQMAEAGTPLWPLHCLPATAREFSF